MKCKGCEGEIKHVPLALVKAENKESYHWAGPALTHSPAEFCEWFRDTPAAQIIAYINVVEYKAKMLLRKRKSGAQNPPIIFACLHYREGHAGFLHRIRHVIAILCASCHSKLCT